MSLDKRRFRPTADATDASNGAAYPTYDEHAVERPAPRGRRGFLKALGVGLASTLLLGAKGAGCMPVPRSRIDEKKAQDAGVDARQTTNQPATPAKRPSPPTNSAPPTQPQR